MRFWPGVCFQTPSKGVDDGAGFLGDACRQVVKERDENPTTGIIYYRKYVLICQGGKL